MDLVLGWGSCQLGGKEPIKERGHDESRDDNAQDDGQRDIHVQIGCKTTRRGLVDESSSKLLDHAGSRVLERVPSEKQLGRISTPLREAGTQHRPNQDINLVSRQGSRVLKHVPIKVQHISVNDHVVPQLRVRYLVPVISRPLLLRTGEDFEMLVHRRASPVNSKVLVTSSNCDVAVVETGGSTVEACTVWGELCEEVADISAGFCGCVIESDRVCRALLGKVEGESVDTELSVGYIRTWEKLRNRG